MEPSLQFWVSEGLKDSLEYFNSNPSEHGLHQIGIPAFARIPKQFRRGKLGKQMSLVWVFVYNSGGSYKVYVPKTMIIIHSHGHSYSGPYGIPRIAQLSPVSFSPPSNTLLPKSVQSLLSRVDTKHPAHVPCPLVEFVVVFQDFLVSSV